MIESFSGNWFADCIVIGILVCSCAIGISVADRQYKDASTLVVILALLFVMFTNIARHEELTWLLPPNGEVYGLQASN
jgi:hypothetical protein